MTAVTTTEAPLLAVSDLHVTIGDAHILDGVDLDLRGGELLGLAGPNGAGKTTLLRATTGVVPADRGQIELDGGALDSFSRLELARRIAVVQQLPEAPSTITVGELVLLGRNPYLRLLGRESAHDYRVVDEAMRRAGCEMFSDRALGTLSGGERRRAFIARALAQEPSLLLLDEPTANLDPEAQGAIFETLRELAQEGAGVLVVVHDLTLAGAYCDRIALIDGGRIVATGTPSDVLTAETVRRVYGERVSVMRHPRSGAPVVVPSVLEDGR
ncbi:MAG TPA: ABC transporter ATP-binding protein [Dehalococcoidia bacterium]|jgi:iron complex transport system ATP-binding protein|nr:ABC transporter ATP-binding protein [Dehalococcoidia bacterium]